jgi:copper chaperone CopZ
MGKTTVLTVEGMHCGKCVEFVSKALESVPGVQRALVDLDAKQATIEGEADTAALIAAVEEEGYTARVA